MRALYQRSKGRDVFDLWLALRHPDFNASDAILIFLEYMKRSGNIINRDMFEKNISLKLMEDSFMDDIGTLLSFNLKKTHSDFLATQDGIILTTETGARLATKGWNLADSTKEIRGKILIHLPNNHF